jgi:hypothetical protein
MGAGSADVRAKGCFSFCETFGEHGVLPAVPRRSPSEQAERGREPAPVPQPVNERAVLLWRAVARRWFVARENIFRA